MRNKVLIVLYFHTLLLCAQNNARIFSSDGSVFKVFVQEKLYNQTPQASVLLEQITRDTLYVKVEFENHQKYGLSLYLLEKGKPARGKEFNFKISRLANKVKVDYQGHFDIVPLPRPLVPKEPVVDTMAIYRNSTLGHFCKLNAGKPQFFNNIPKNGQCTQAMPEEYTNYIHSVLTKAETEVVRIKLTTEICENNCLNVKQLSNILTYIDYELEKLKLLRIAYFNLVDTLNRGELYKSFRFESSIKELTYFFKNTGAYKPRQFGDCKQASGVSEVEAFTTKLILFGNDVQTLEAFKREYTTYCYSIKQVIKLLKIYVHDREKLESAKLIYFYCVDKANFSETFDLFSYKETASELNEFINKQKK